MNLQTSADAIIRFANIKEDEDMVKTVCNSKLLESERMVLDKCYREYTRLPKDETGTCLEDALSGLRQLLATEDSLKMLQNAFNFI